METVDNNCSILHSYATKSLELTFTVGLELMALPETPDNHPAKKTKTKKQAKHKNLKNYASFVSCDATCRKNVGRKA